jgi:hypothetical protein
MTALGRHRTFEAPLTASDRARLASYHRQQLARFSGTRDAAPPQKRTDIHIHLPPGWVTRDAAPRRGRDAEPGSTGGLPLARKNHTVEPGSAGFEDLPAGPRLRALAGELVRLQPSRRDPEAYLGSPDDLFKIVR